MEGQEKVDGFGETRHQKGWREGGRETKLNESNGEYFRAVATPNREKPKEEEDFKTFVLIVRDIL